MNVFVIIVTYNAMRWIERCLQSLRLSTVPVNVLVVDNLSSDGTVSYIKNHFPEVTVFEQKVNLGFGQGNNIGIRYALQQSADYMLLLNQDAWIDPDMLERLLPYDDGKILLSPVHLNGTHTALDHNFRQNAVERSGYRSMLESDPLLKHATGCYPAKEICAACWLLSRSLVERIGGFNPLFFHYNEDNNYQHRLFYHGYSIAWVGSAYVCHDREYREHIPVKYHRVRQELLLRSSDINVSRIKCFFHQCRYGLGVIHQAFIDREPVAIWYLLRAFMELAFCTHGKVSASRRQEKILQSNWL